MQIILKALEELKKRIDNPHITFSIEDGDSLKCTIEGLYGPRPVSACHMMSYTQIVYGYQAEWMPAYLLDITMNKLLQLSYVKRGNHEKRRLEMS